MFDTSIRSVARKVILLSPLTLLLGIPRNAATAQSVPVAVLNILNSGFEDVSTPSTESGPVASWDGGSMGGKAYELKLDATQHVDGQYSLRSKRILPMELNSKTRQFALAMQEVPVLGGRGLLVRLSGWIRSENIDSGYAGLWLRTDAAGHRVLKFDNMETRGVKGTTGWTRYVVELPVDSGTAVVTFGALHTGTGVASFDSLKLELLRPPAGSGELAATPIVSNSAVLQETVYTLPRQSAVRPKSPY